MHIAIIGAAGMIGRKLIARLMKDGAPGGGAIDALTLIDIVMPQAPDGFSGRLACLAEDLSAAGVAERLIATRPDLIFHLAAIVSAEAETDFELGYRVNLEGMRLLLESIRLAHRDDVYRPRLVFTSSIAVFGAPFPDKIGDDFMEAPLTSYGTQKAICELLLSDYSRKGFVDGIGIRLPTICVRPGKPNKAASGFFSGIIREPLNGQEAILPVGDDVRHWHASPRSAVGFLVRAASMDLQSLGARRNLSMPGISSTVGEQIEALRKVAGDKAVRLIRRVPDEMIMRIVAGWARDFDTARALSLGFVADASFEDIIRIHIEDELSPAQRTDLRSR